MRPGALLAALGGLALAGAAARARLAEGDPPGRVAATALLGAALVAAGVVLWTRRPGSGGPLLAATGWAWLGWNLRDVASATAFTVAWGLVGLYLALVLVLALAFPGDLPRGGAERSLAALALAAALVAGPVAMLFWDSRTTGDTLVLDQNLLAVDPDPGVRSAMLRAAVIAGLAVAVGALALCGRRWRAGGPAARRAYAPVVLALGAFAAFLAVRFSLQAWTDLDPDAGAFAWAGLAALALVPAGVGAGLVRGRARPVAVADLVSGLEEPLGPGAIELALARALGDPSLRVLVPGAPGGWLDAAGAPAAAPSADGGGVTRLTRGGRVVGLLVHDASLGWRPELLRAAGATAALALDNARLGADARRRLVEVRAARRRLLEAGDAERRRLERDLHDGAQQRLVALGLLLRMARGRAEDGGAPLAVLLEEAERGVVEALEELRNLARGIHPAALEEGGLGPALRVMAARAPVPVEVDCPDVRLPRTVETAAWFVVSEALANVAKHAGASRASVRVTLAGGLLRVEVSDDGRGGARASPGSGLSGLSERIAALDGVLSVVDGEGGGTRLVAELPCA